VASEKDEEFRLQIERLTSTTIQLCSALIAVRRAVDIISKQPSLSLLQADREKIQAEIENSIARTDGVLNSLDELLSINKRKSQ
jgi:hypothetical protein